MMLKASNSSPSPNDYLGGGVSVANADSFIREFAEFGIAA